VCSICRYNFLCKQEKRGDLRKDARMMEAASLVNRVLVKDSHGRRRDLHLRTYAVTILKEDCGMLQWVPNTTAMRHEINKAYEANGQPNAMHILRVIRAEFEDMQKRDVDDRERGKHFRTNVAARFPALFHKWFNMSFADPTDWFEARCVGDRTVGAIVACANRVCAGTDTRSRLRLLLLTLAGSTSLAPRPCGRWWATSSAWATATARTSSSTRRTGSACTSTSTACSTRASASRAPR